MPRYHRKSWFSWKMAGYVLGGSLVVAILLAVCFQGVIRAEFKNWKIRKLEDELSVVVESKTQLLVREEEERNGVAEVVLLHELHKMIETYRAQEEELRGQIEALRK